MVHDAAHVQAALRAAHASGRPVTLVSAPGAGHYLGAGYFHAMIEAGAAGIDTALIAGTVLDCDDRPGTALAALRAGMPAVRLRAGSEVLRKVGEIARKLGAAVNPETGPTLDLLDEAEPERACRNWLD